MIPIKTKSPTQKSTTMKTMKFTSLAAVALLGSILPAMSATYTYNTTSGTPTENWSTGTGWSGTPVSASDTTLTFVDPNTTNFATGAAPISNNDNAGSFLLNSLNLQGTDPASGTATLTIQGGTLQFVNNGLTGPTVNLNALSSPTTDLTYTVSSAIHLANDTTFGGTGTAAFNFSGAITGSGNLTKTGISVLSLSGTTSNTFAYTGNIDVQGGTLKPTGVLFTKGGLQMATGGTFDLSGGTVAVSSLSGSGGSITDTHSGGTFGTLYVNHAGSTTDAYGGTFANTSLNRQYGIVSAGSGDLSLPTVAGGGNAPVSLTNMGSGTITTAGVTGNSQGQVVLSNPYATVRLTGTSGLVNGSGITTNYGGLLSIAPTGSGSDVVVTGQTVSNSGAGVFRYIGGATLELDKGSNNSVTFTIGGGATGTNPVLSRGLHGTLVLDPVNGAATLGSSTGAKFAILKNTSTGAVPVLTNGIANTSIVVVDNDADRSADFVTYTGTGIVGDVGFQQATYSNTFTTPDSFAGTTNASVVKNTATQNLASNTAAFALRNDDVITLGGGVSLTLGNGAGQAGLILNGGTISSGTLAFGGAEATIYTSGADGTISSKITGSVAATAPGLNKFGEGTLYLTNGTNSYTGQTYINSGALDVGTISANALPNASFLRLSGGVIQGNGTFSRNLVAASSSASGSFSWDDNASQGSGTINGGGGFAAKGGALVVKINNNLSTLTWQGSTATIGITSTGFLRDGTPLVFGSNTSDDQVDFQNGIDLGTANTGVYYRTIHVNQGTGTDSAKISGVISSTAEHGLIKDGAGKLIFTGNNTYTGDTVVSEGTLLINGNQSAATGSTTVNSGATLGGNGTIGGAVIVNAGASLNPGNSPGLLTINGPLTLAGTTVMEIASGTRGTDFDGVNLGDGQLLTYGGTLTLTMAGAIADGTYDLFSSVTTLTPLTKTGNFSSIAFAGGYYSGTFSRLGDVWTSTLTNGQIFTFDQVTGDLVAAVPEPSTWVLLALGLTIVIIMRRRRMV